MHPTEHSISPTCVMPTSARTRLGVSRINATKPLLILLLACGLLIGASARADSSGRVALADHWQIQSSAKAGAEGAMISTTAFKPADWYPATVPSTVVGTLVDDKVYPDPFFGMNLKSIPGME